MGAFPNYLNLLQVDSSQGVNDQEIDFFFFFFNQNTHPPANLSSKGGPQALVKVSQYGPVLCTNKRFSGRMPYRKEERTAACQNPLSKAVTMSS